MNTSFNLSRDSSLLKLEFSIIHHVPQERQTLGSNILASIPNTSLKIRDVSVNASLVNDVTRDSLSDSNLFFVSNKVSLSTSFSIFTFHGIQGTHSSVLLQSDSIGVKVFSRSLCSSCQQTSHHDCRCTQSKGFNDVSNRRNASISDDGNSVLSSNISNFEDGSCLKR